MNEDVSGGIGCLLAALAFALVLATCEVVPHLPELLGAGP